MRRLAALCLAASLATTACMDVEQVITLEKDLSGTAALNMKLDMEPMIVMFARLQHMMGGGQGEPPADLLAQVRQGMLESIKDDPVDFEEEKESLRKSLPEGVKMLDASFTQDGLKFGGGFLLGFDKLSRLNEIKVDAPDLASAVPLDSPLAHPFEGLTITEEKGTILITGPTTNPFADIGAKPGEPLNAEGRAVIEPLIKGFRVAMKFVAPFEVVEHNATRREGTTLVWEYDFATIEKVLDGGPMPAVRVRYKK